LNRHFVVSEGGLEPPRPCGHQPLKLARLPIPPLRLVCDWDERPEIVARGPLDTDHGWSLLAAVDRRDLLPRAATAWCCWSTREPGRPSTGRYHRRLVLMSAWPSPHRSCGSRPATSVPRTGAAPPCRPRAACPPCVVARRRVGVELLRGRGHQRCRRWFVVVRPVLRAVLPGAPSRPCTRPRPDSGRVRGQRDERQFGRPSDSALPPPRRSLREKGDHEAGALQLRLQLGAVAAAQGSPSSPQASRSGSGIPSRCATVPGPNQIGKSPGRLPSARLPAEGSGVRREVDRPALDRWWWSTSSRRRRDSGWWWSASGGALIPL
jgi:hypothetical protein